MTLKNSFREAVGLKALTDEEEEAEDKKRLAAGNDHEDPFSKIMVNEAARILSDYIADQARPVVVQTQ